MTTPTAIDPWSVTRHGFHADGLDARGHNLPDRTWGWDMPILGDFATLEEARAWAARIFLTDARVMVVVITAMISKPYGTWKYAGTVERIERGDVQALRYTIRPVPEYNHLPGDDTWMVVAPDGCHGGGSCYAGKEFAQAAADRLSNGTSLRRH